MPKTDGSLTKGEVTAEQLKATRSELARLAQRLTEREQTVAEKSAAASLAEQIQALRQERKQEREGQTLPAHRPSEYTEEIASTLLQWIAEGGSLRSWSRESGIPPMTIYRWMAAEATFRERYARAHEDRADSLADEILDIADEVAGTDSIASVQAAKLRVETRKWIASKLRPQKWGEKQVVEQTGSVTFNLGIPLKRGDQGVIDGKSLITEGISDGSTDCKSENLIPLPPSRGNSSSGEPAEQPGDAPCIEAGEAT